MSKPDRVRRLRGSYNTFKDLNAGTEAAPFGDGWTASMVGGGSGVWGTWTYRALPVDFRLATHFRSQKLGSASQLDWLAGNGYAVVDWPIGYGDLAPYYDIAEALLAVSGDRQLLNTSIEGSDWFAWLKGLPHFGNSSDWLPSHPYPGAAYPITPVGHFAAEAMRAACYQTAPLPTSIVAPPADADAAQIDTGYLTRDHLQAALDRWSKTSGALPAFWQRAIAQLWSARRRQRCNLCGFCGGFLCWGAGGPKSGALTTTLLEFVDMKANAELRPDSLVYEITIDPKQKRASGVRYLDVSMSRGPTPRRQKRCARET